MKASELVALLNAEIEKYGDLEVIHYHMSQDTTVDKVCTYNERGNSPTDDLPAVEIYIH